MADISPDLEKLQDRAKRILEIWDDEYLIEALDIWRGLCSL